MKKLIHGSVLMCLVGSAVASDKTEFAKTLKQYSNKDLTVSQVNETPMNGVKEVIVHGEFGQEIFYMSENGQYMLEGKLLDLKNRVDLKAVTENSLRKELIADHADSLQSIDFYPDVMKDHITVFTDIDCGYCRKMHQEVQGYNDLGIGISYVFFPRTGLKSESYDKAVNVWCASDQKQAMGAAKSGQVVEPKMCKNPITSQFDIGVKAGVHKLGTPSVVLEDGSMTGYLAPAAMKGLIDAHKK